ncbi:MAG: argininosuccinate lyase [Anaerolineae bacterium]|nr:argininosuccinate lyase [Anaerolineae bacterium]
MWGGRFGVEMTKLMAQFNASIGFDWRLYKADVRGSQAYARALVNVGVLTKQESERIVAGLDQVLQEFDSQAFAFLPDDEDIHTAVERRLGELIGSVAGKLHTGRSRNDQVATDMRLYVLEKIDELCKGLDSVQAAVIEQSETQVDLLMPGYTHLQPAQPVLFSHWLMSYFWMLQRDRQRLDEIKKRVAVLPLGASALAGNAFPIDCNALAQDLGFLSIAQNSIDAVSDRDFVAEFLFWAALLQTHLSRLAEDLVLWSNPTFGFVTVDERYSTGSSIMPQKRNPDSLELIRAKTGRINGALVSILTLLKGLPSSYDKDLQEDKEPLFDVIDTLSMVLPIAAGVISTLQVHSDRLLAALDQGLLATELADYLVAQGLPFRKCHSLVGQAVRMAEESGCTLAELSPESYQSIDTHFKSDLYDVLDFRRAVERRSVFCGTATKAVQAQIGRAKALLGKTS